MPSAAAWVSLFGAVSVPALAVGCGASVLPQAAREKSSAQQRIRERIVRFMEYLPVCTL